MNLTKKRKFIPKDERIRRKRAKRKKNNIGIVGSETPEETGWRVASSNRSPFTGVKFPEGSQGIAFEAYVRNNGVYSVTLREIKEKKLLGNRKPSLRTLRSWAKNNHWDVLRQLVDDGIYELLDIKGDPNIQEFIHDQEAYMKVLGKLRSQILLPALERNSHLLPKSSSELVKLLGFISVENTKFDDRMGDAAKRSGGSNKPTEDDEALPGNVTDIAEAMAKAGKPVTGIEIAREAQKRKRAAEEELEERDF